ncbi:DUF3558 domain-containing protein [Kibdelosporangium phytohabitans]|nr:DUF3558 domain-containing protein [Kibdelosporangium phytohabitans]
MGSRAKLGLVVAGCMALTVLAGCSKEEPGTPTASVEETPDGTTQRPTTKAPSETASADKIDPCSLLPDADAAKFGLATPGKARTGNFGIPECKWTASGKFIVGISFANKKLAEFTGDAVTLPKRKAVQTVDGGGFRGCSIVLELTDTVSAFNVVSSVDNAPGAQMCPQALEIAKVMDSKLP